MLSLNAFLRGHPRHNFTRVVTTSRLEGALMFKGQLDTGVGINLGVDNRKDSFKEKFLKKNLFETAWSTRIFSLIFLYLK